MPANFALGARLSGSAASQLDTSRKWGSELSLLLPTKLSIGDNMATEMYASGACTEKNDLLNLTDKSVPFVSIMWKK